MSDNSVRLHRILTTSVEKVFRAFSDNDAYSSWISPYGHICTIDSREFKEKGSYKMAFKNFTTGNGHSFGGEFLEITKNKSITYTDRFDDPNLPGEILTTVEFKEVMCGMELTIHQTNIPEAIPAELCYLGWQECLDKLKRLVEPEITDM
ncbi:activator of Hsp90 ATPase 1 family protein [Galbibacter marinus]|uniref:Activator of Hsp90 ATPase 1 family protein n=1 Tax=Galbibacter marinus TaxID=555500 RepID=K2PRE6_9FLAO|nr:SRPBCC family protein [Galbibacter marinus]EKF55145.1 activator of Hsp90 ATPase 1 family protein [Galbibacter marinus]